MRICVVGGVNFMGPDVVRKLVDAGHEVLSYHSAAHERELPAAVRHLHGQRDELERFRAAVRRELKRYGGEEIDTAGDGFFVTFAGPGRAIRCAKAITEAVRPLGIEARAGVHIGEVEVYGSHVSGVAVHVGARLMALARGGEVIVSTPLHDVVSGSSIEMRDRGDHELKGVPGTWRVYSVSAA